MRTALINQMEQMKEFVVEKTLDEPRVEDGAVFFTVVVGNEERECFISKNALAYLGQLQGTMDALNIFQAFESSIIKVAKRLVLAGESASPLILGAGYFIDLFVRGHVKAV